MRFWDGASIIIIAKSHEMKIASPLLNMRERRFRMAAMTLQLWRSRHMSFHWTNMTLLLRLKSLIGR